ncbi:MAG: hypothetical protein CM15mP120_09960 [Pseudomonadota bacterium]|nr:MAG: hypothetical protein CM15mP120_09960 [Pseudomonadota bacterium]
MNSPVPASFHAAMIFVFAALLGTPDSGRADETAAAEDQYTWDLTDFYPSKAAWKTELERLRSEVNFLAPYAGKRDDAATLFAALEANSTYSG